MKLSIPVEKTFNFTTIEGSGFTNIRRMEDGESFDPESCFTVTIRQATRTESDQRTAMLNKRTYKVDRTDGDLLQMDDFNPDELAKLEIYMTLSDTDLEYPDVVREKGEEKTVYKRIDFLQAGSVKRVKDRRQFEKWWGLLYDQWAKLIYEACLEVNPKWDTTKSNE